MTILLSSHILSEVESLCDRVSIIRDGRNVESGSLAQLRHLARITVDATLRQPITSEELATVPGLDRAPDGGLTDHHVVCTVESNQLGQLLELLGRHGIKSLTSAPPTLEQLFMAQYRSSPGGLAGSEADPSAPEAATTR